MTFKRLLSAVLILCLSISTLNIVVSAVDNDVFLYIDFEDYAGGSGVPNGFTEKAGQLWPTRGGCCEPYVDETGNTMLKVVAKASDPVWRYELPSVLKKGRYLMTFKFRSTGLNGIRSFLYYSDITQNARGGISLKCSDYQSKAATEKLENNEMLNCSILFDFNNGLITSWIENDVDNKTVGSMGALQTAGLAQFFFVYWDKIDASEYVLMDDIKIVRQPIGMGIDSESQQVGNIFYDDEQIFVPMFVTNDSDKDREVTFSYDAKSRSGKAVGSGEKKIVVPANGKIVEKIYPEMDFYDTAAVTVTVTDENGEQISDNYDFSRVLSSKGQNPLFGVSAHNMRGWTPDYEYRAIMLEKAGFSFIREDMEWQRTELMRGNVTALDGWDKFITDLKKHNIDFLATMGLGNTLYDNKGLPYTKEAVSAYANYCSYFADYLKIANGANMEIWNEADLMGNAAFNPASRPASDYRNLMIEASKAIKKSNPDANVIGGVQANIASESWTREVLSEGGAESIDTYSIHYYSHTSAPETGGILTRVENSRKVVDEFNPDIDLWLTEMGYFAALQPTIPARQHTIEEQAAWAVRLYMILENQGIVSKMFWYDYINDGIDKTNAENNYGLVKAIYNENVPMAAKPVYLSIAAMNSMITDAKHIGIVNPDERTYINRYKKENGQDLLTLWSLDMKDNIGLKCNNKVKVYDLNGNLKCELNPVNGVLNIQIGYEPIYVIGDIPETEVCTPNITADRAYATVCEGDVFENTVSVNGENNYTLEVSDGEGIDVKENEGKSKFTLEMNNKAGELTRIPAELKDKDGNTVFVAEYLIKKNEEPVTVRVLAQPYDFSNQNRWCAVVTVTNNTMSTVLNGEVKLTEPADFAEYAKTVSFKNLGPKQETTLKINLPEMIKKNAKYIGVSVLLDNGKEIEMRKYSSFAIANFAENKIVIDGKRSEGEWTGTALTMDKSTWALADQVANGKMFADESDLSANAWIMYDNERFYLFVDVCDNIFSQDYKNDEIWNGDSIQIGIDDISGAAIYATEYSEIGCALTKDGVQFYRWKSVDKRDSEVKDTEAVVIHKDGHTYYEMSIPWTELITKPENITDYYDFGFAMLVNDNDGYGRRGWCEYTTGIGRVKDTSTFGRLILSKPENMNK